ncbi:MAG: type II toxin-antitoxin system Phd/YefM family antitoxin [Actinobacteria bacterium]|nr:type II toxin-antitoxin system Phd/YefM family antitoxin [Actinomycetota bacterium]MBM3697636.1 type II toxin-antitoxin system Phd/YefM family antitoxin [Actinomycetota bacterium]
MATAPSPSSSPTHVPVAEAKAKFSEMLRRAGEGEEIVVTSHGRPVARIMPPADPRPSREQWIADLMEFRRSGRGIKATREEIVEWIREGRRH